MSPFGAGQRGRFHLDPELTYLNHGTVGAPPRAVLEAQQRLRDHIETNPARFLLRELPTRMREAAQRVAGFVGCEGRDMAFVDNTTTGIQAILRSFPWRSGDALLVGEIGYGGVNNGATYVARERGIRLDTFAVELPIGGPQAVIDAVDAALTAQTRIAIVDHINSNTGTVWPIAEIARLCRARGVLLLVDGAHAPGSIALDIASIGGDWYVGNLHKWAWTPRSSALIWCSEAQQPHLHPPVISWGLDQGMAAEFDLVGTRDPSPHLSAPTAIDLLEETGFPELLKYTHDLARQGARMVAEALGGEAFGDPSMTATMAPVLLPETLGTTFDEAMSIRARMYTDHHIETHVNSLQGRLCMRIAAQIYNEPEEYERLAAALRS